MRRVLLFLSPLVAAGAIWLLVSALLSTGPDGDFLGRGSEPAAAEPDGLLSYNAKFVCGTVTEGEFSNGGPHSPVVPGTYETAINVHNPSLTEYVYIDKWWYVALPGETLGPYGFLDWYELPPNHAIEVDCYEIMAALVAAGLDYTFAKGFIEVYTYTGEPLDVTAVYTAQHTRDVLGSEGLGQAIDVEPVPPRPHTEEGDPTAPSSVYAAKFVCGSSAGPDPVVKGDYASAINVFNPHEFPVGIQKKVVLAEREPATEAEFGDISEWSSVEVMTGLRAFEIDCEDIRGFFESAVTGFIKGFVVIETRPDPTGAWEFYNGELDVVPVYTVRRVTWGNGENAGYGMDIEVLRISGKGKSLEPGEATPTPTSTPTSTPTPTVTETPTVTATPTVLPPSTEYEAYGISGAPLNQAVTLQTQFGYQGEVTILQPMALWAPAIKNGIFGTTNAPHFKCYFITGGHDPADKWVNLYDQFTEEYVEVGPAYALCLGALKNNLEGEPPPQHYECYTISGADLFSQVHLEDQFSDEDITVYYPELLCAPAWKNGVEDQDLYGQHFKCYYAPTTDPTDVVSLKTQFSTETGVAVDEGTWLCTDVYKEEIVQFCCDLCPEGEACFDTTTPGMCTFNNCIAVPNATCNTQTWQCEPLGGPG